MRTRGGGNSINLDGHHHDPLANVSDPDAVFDLHDDFVDDNSLPVNDNVTDDHYDSAQSCDSGYIPPAKKSKAKTRGGFRKNSLRTRGGRNSINLDGHHHDPLPNVSDPDFAFDLQGDVLHDPLPNVSDPDVDLHDDFVLNWTNIPREKRQFDFTGPRRGPNINVDIPSGPLQVFKTFITEEMVNNIVLFTNSYADKSSSGGRTFDWKIT